MQSACALVLSLHLAAAVFFHEKSSIELVPEDLKDSSSFGFSLGYQKGERPNLVIGAPRFDQTGRVYQRSIADILAGQTACQHIDIDFDKLKVYYNRSMSPNQYFNLGASIAATEKFFLTCAPLRTAYGSLLDKNGSNMDIFGAYGTCFNYDSTTGVHQYNGYGLESYIKNKMNISNIIYGGSGWSTLVDEARDVIAISKSFGVGDITLGRISQPDKKTYWSLKGNGQRNIAISITNFGQAMTFGNYFHAEKNIIFYAVSMKNVNSLSSIAFFDIRWQKLNWILDDDTSVGSMFGAALCSADVTGDGRAELVVGAPAHVADTRSYDKGAVHVYTKSETPSEQKMILKLTILGVKDGARFGTTLSSNDVDGDSYPEILVSAPWENSGVGAMYVLCGYEIHKTLKRTSIIFVSDLKRAQRIEAAQHRTFGYSVQPVADFNDNGSDELGIGSPGNSKVKLYKGIRSVTANVTSRFLGIPSESDSQYVFSSCVAVYLPPKPTIVTTKLLVKNVLNGNGAKFKNKNEATYLVNLSGPGQKIDNGKTEYCRNLYIESSSFCKVTTNVSLLENFQSYKDFQNTWVTLSAQSVLEKTVQLMCLCNETSCAPELNVTMEWSGRNETKYLVGSSSLENVTISVHNSGTMGCNVCVKVRVSGALVDQLQCELDGGEYECAMLNPFRGNTTQKIELVLLMDKLTNEDKRFTIDVAVRKNCAYPEASKESFTVEYLFNTEAIVVNGSCTNRNISDTELMDKSEDIISDEQTYSILNNQSVTWNNVWANISVVKKPYIQGLKVFIKQAQKCIELNDTKKFYWHCSLTLAPYSTVELTVSTTTLKKEITNYLQDWKITIASELLLELSPNVIKNKTLTTVMTFEKELTLGQDKTLIVVIAVIVALLLLLIFAFILYKLNFFKRKNKEELKALKSEFRRRSTKRRNTTGSSSEVNPNPNPGHVSHCDMADLMIVEESPFDNTSHQEPNSDANVKSAK